MTRALLSVISLWWISLTNSLGIITTSSFCDQSLMDQSLTRPSYLFFENKWILEQGFTNLVSGKWQEPKERRPETCYLVDAWHGSLCMIRQFLKGWGIKQAGEKKKSLFCMTYATNFYKSLFGSYDPSHLRPLAPTSRAAASTSSRSKAEQQGS